MYVIINILMISIILIIIINIISIFFRWESPSDTTKRGSLPSAVEYVILAWVAGHHHDSIRFFHLGYILYSHF